MENYWLEHGKVVIEKEVLLVKSSKSSPSMFGKMSGLIPAIYTLEGKNNYPTEDEFSKQIGYAHHLRLTRLGIEAVLKLPRKYHRMPFFILHAPAFLPNDPFWLVVY